MQTLYLCKVEPDYLKYLHSFDVKVSVKYNNRPFVGVITMINGMDYVIPLTSQTTAERGKQGKKKRSSKLTTFVRDDRNREISNILHNNMIPVIPGTYSILEIQANRDTYQAQEIRYIRKNQKAIIEKAQKVYNLRIQNDEDFLTRICCNFQLLESVASGYRK